MAYRYIPPHEQLHSLLDEIADMIPRITSSLSHEADDDTTRHLRSQAIGHASALRYALQELDTSEVSSWDTSY